MELRPVYYRLKAPFLLRGWERLPHALTDMRTGHTAFVNEIGFQALSLCNGVLRVDNPALMPIHREAIAELHRQGVVEECQEGANLSPLQKYRRYPCRYIRQAHWSMTGRCNYRCRHCYMAAPEGKYGEIAREQCLGIIEQFQEAGIFQVSLTGGEPLVRTDFLDLIDALLDKKIHIRTIYSNGALIHPRLLDALKERGIQPAFSISFDGVGRHDWLRGVSGAEQAAVDAMRLLQERGFSVEVEMSLHRGNVDTLEASVRLLAELGVRHLKTSPTSEAGNWTREQGKYSLGAEELYARYLDYLPRYRAAGAPLALMLGGFFSCSRGSEDFHIPCKKFDGSHRALRQTVCASARTTMYVAADGKLLPCIPLTGLSIQEEMPNILEMGLIQALSDSRYLQAIDTRLEDLLRQNPRCDNCRHKLHCGGGCRAGALLTDGHYLGSDEYTCTFFRGNYEEKIRYIYTGKCESLLLDHFAPFGLRAGCVFSG